MATGGRNKSAGPIDCEDQHAERDDNHDQHKSARERQRRKRPSDSEAQREEERERRQPSEAKPRFRQIWPALRLADLSGGASAYTRVKRLCGGNQRGAR